MRDLSGVHPPVATPFGEDGELALDAFDNNLREWLSHPIAGIVVAGSTGEAPLLDRRELCALVETTAARIGDRTLTVGTGAESTREVISVTREVAGLGANAVLVRSGSYYLKAMRPDVVRDHFLAVADASPVPVVLYHIPQFVPVHLTPDLVGRLVEHPNIIGIKDSSGDLRNLGQLIEACGRNAQVLVGSGALLYAALEAGAAGGILGVAVIATRSCCQIYDAWKEGDHRRAGAMQERVAPLHKSLVAEGGIAAVKAALDRLGLYGGVPRSPLQPADAAKLAKVDAALEAAALGVSA
ncbi:dihydrodipicolinate synthase family protein [Candidatus Palauibacter soopunensis]|uniref:dihydrodipicolinate synthase family protein n=1 Tax=Candidatus Palauibacter soopunensis TaxID=3056739 RepID=UPI0023904173|nr:dihydrodipicolinate synthase family protein [Candidatus Palauibacter soopunensis]MDE2878676.1 dihydrodipicolinate synthase family protein [Candidatus Palauibacter soopunensis]